MTKKILALPGDGIGKEVMASTLNVLHYLIESHDLDFLIRDCSSSPLSFLDTPNRLHVNAKFNTSIEGRYDIIFDKVSILNSTSSPQELDILYAL